ncbi:tyrosine-type recombinase/integrase [Hyphomicrobium sp. 2TAF46]|uniref:tyrosine-type recombinase/integrase n=1 Tax=Hyphomicrobium sp. 2TAF46 TaxID=3233019 RepID=UPI003F8E1619
MVNELSAPSETAVVPLSEDARKFIAQSARPNTRRAYAAQLKQWLAWCEASSTPPFPAEPNAVANYLSARATKGQTVSTLRTAVAAIKAGHDAQGLTFDSKAPAIVRTLRGITNTAPRIAKQAEPIRGRDILDLMDSTDASLIGVRDAALLALGYVFALRRSELVALDLENQGDGDGVLRITARTMEVSLAIAKTSAAGEVQTVAVPRLENAEAVQAVEAWISLAGIKKGEPLLRHVRKGGKLGGRLHPQSVAKIVKVRIGMHYEDLGASREDAQTEAARYSGHSMRVGFCVAAAESGADLRAIASVSRHRSLSMPARYSQRAEQIRTSPHRLPGVGLSRS